MLRKEPTPTEKENSFSDTTKAMPKERKPKAFWRMVAAAAIVIGIAAAQISRGSFENFSTRRLTPVSEKNVECNIPSYTDAQECAKIMRCGRWVFDDVFETDVLVAMENMVDDILARAQGGGTGPPSVIDLHGRVVSYKEKFMNLDVVFEHHKWNVSRTDIKTYQMIRQLITDTTMRLSGVHSKLFYMDRAFFSHINGSKTAKTLHDEYWHQHIDVEQYGTFAYTALLYFGGAANFTGGDFVFTNDNHTITPKRNRLLVFSSGEENPHMVNPVENGIRLAFTSAVTCNVAAKVDPSVL